jgi:hypothetical protein
MGREYNTNGRKRNVDRALVGNSGGNRQECRHDELD